MDRKIDLGICESISPQGETNGFVNRWPGFRLSPPAPDSDNLSKTAQELAFLPIERADNGSFHGSLVARLGGGRLAELPNTNGGGSRHAHPKKLTVSQVVAIREARAGGEDSTSIGRRFGVSQSMVCLICTGRAWAAAPGPVTRVYQDRTLPPAVRFASLVHRGGEGECWPWLGGRTEDGYGIFNFAAGSVIASRFALEQHLGRSLSGDEETCHSCDNPPCCNPAHLFPGTKADNVADMMAKGRHSSKLTPAEVRAIRSIPMGRGDAAGVGKRYGISATQVLRIVRGLVWKQLPSQAVSR